MKTMVKHFFLHPAIWVYLIVFTSIIIYLSFFYGHIFKSHWWLILITIVFAPFLEWFTHKYILHWKIGKFKRVDASILGEVKPGDTIVYENSRYKVLSIKNNQAYIGYGIAPMLPEFIRKGMYTLHYGHHENPNNIKLIFAPITFSIGLFSVMFIGAYALTFRLDIAMLFTSSVIAYYLYYEWVHLGHHIAEYKPITSWSKKLKKAHLFHHYHNENLWWGITNSLGDYLMGTYKKQKETNQSETTMDINSF